MNVKESAINTAHDVLIRTTDPTIVKAGTPLLAIFGIPIAQVTEMVDGYGTIITTVLGIIAVVYLIIGRHLANRKTKLEAEAIDLANQEARIRIEIANEEARQKIEALHEAFSGMANAGGAGSTDGSDDNKPDIKVVKGGKDG